MLRLCVAKQDKTLDEAIDRLRSFSQSMTTEDDDG
jgi:hypothetical protein